LLVAGSQDNLELPKVGFGYAELCEAMDRMALDLVDLRLFCQITEAGSITHGAERANLSAAAASERLSGIEHVLGTPVFDRTPKGVQLTPAGQMLLYHAHLILEQMERMHDEMRLYSSGLKSRIRLLSITAGVREILPQQLAAFLSSHPNIDIDLEERSTGEIIEAVAAGFADVGIITDALSHGKLQTFPLGFERLVVVVSRNSKFAERVSIPFRDVVQCDMISFGKASALDQKLGQLAARLGHHLKVRVRLTSFEAICRTVEADVGIAIIPQTAANRYVDMMQISAIPLSDEWSALQLMICVNLVDKLPSHTRELLSFLGADLNRMRQNR
jgi:DNA-binding transcriptional LysR family regulator